MTPVTRINSAARFFGDIFRNASLNRIHLCKTMATLETLNFDNITISKLPIDKEEANFVRIVKGACYSRTLPTPVENPKLVAISKSALSLLDLSELECGRQEFVEFFSGNKILPGSVPIAHCYCGHQFGYFAGQLGDGAAITLGEIVNKSSERWEIQLKGSGKTPYSRTADGRKVLRSSIREFLCSEAMHFLGIPTTRAGCVITSDSQVIRDVFYDGNPILEKCSIVCRIAPTFIRFGSFQICKGSDRETGNSGPSASQPDVLKSLMDHVIETYYSDIWNNYKQNEKELYSEFFGEVVRRTAGLVAYWQCVGWCHGVLNTDNMSILGLTIDYGPYGFLDHYDPNHICNASDTGGRYSYKNQPEMCKWNCEKLADVLQIFAEATELKAHLDEYDVEYEKKYAEIMRKKLGLSIEKETDKDLINGFLDAMEKTGADFTNSFRILGSLPLPRSDGWQNGDQDSSSQLKEKLLLQCSSAEEMRLYNKPNIDPNYLQELILFMDSNPALKIMMGKQQQQIANEIRRYEQFNYWKEMTNDEKKSMDSQIWEDWINSYTKRLEIEVKELTKSVTDDITHNVISEFSKKRTSVMNSANPRFVLRNHIAQEAIDAAEAGDYSVVRGVLEKLQRPYDDEPVATTAHEKPAGVGFDFCSLERPPARSHGIRVT